MDHSGLEAIPALVEKCQSADKKLALVNLSSKSQSMLSNIAPMTEVNGPTEEVPLDKMVADVKTIKILANGSMNGTSG